MHVDAQFTRVISGCLEAYDLFFQEIKREIHSAAVAGKLTYTIETPKCYDIPLWIIRKLETDLKAEGLQVANYFDLELTVVWDNPSLRSYSTRVRELETLLKEAELRGDQKLFLDISEFNGREFIKVQSHLNDTGYETFYVGGDRLLVLV